MANNKDKKGRVLRQGERQRSDGRYEYRFEDASGQTRSIYSWKLVETDKLPKGKRECVALRDQEKLRQQLDGKCDFHITTPKTKNSVREIPMLTEVKNALLEERKRQMSTTGLNDTVIDGYEGFVFQNRFGNVLSPHCVNRAIERIYKDYNEEEAALAKAEHRDPILLPHFTCHVLRHTFCTRFCENETNLKVIQEIMGHADISATMDVYNEATRAKKRESFDNLDGKIKIS